MHSILPKVCNGSARCLESLVGHPHAADEDHEGDQNDGGDDVANGDERDEEVEAGVVDCLRVGIGERIDRNHASRSSFGKVLHHERSRNPKGHGQKAEESE